MDNLIIDEAITIIAPDGVDKKLLCEGITKLIEELKTSQVDDKYYKVTLKIPRYVDENDVAETVEALCTDIEKERADKELEEKIEKMSFKDVLKELKSENLNSYLKIVEKCPLLKTNALINIVTNYYALFHRSRNRGLTFGMNNIVPVRISDIFMSIGSTLILGLLLNIPSSVLRAILNCDWGYIREIERWIRDEIEYYANNNNFRIEYIISNIKPSKYHWLIENYLIEYYRDDVKKLCPDLLRNYDGNWLNGINDVSIIFKSL